MSAEPIAGGHEPLAFAAKLIQLLEEGRRTSTYKFALLVALMDLVRERKGATGQAPETLSMTAVARRVAELYWRQSRRFPDTQDMLVQNRGGQAEILTAIASFKDSHGLDRRSSFGAAERQTDALHAVLRQVELKLARQPVPLLQRIGAEETPVLYQIGWQEQVPASEYHATDRTIHFVPGAAENLVVIAPVLREIVHARWVALVADMNRAVLKQDNLDEFLFGVDREALGRLVAPLRELDGNLCFYCRRSLTEAVEVDHFLAWARYADDGIENLVLADRTCNNSKRPACGSLRASS